MTYEDILINTKQIINNYLEREKIEESNYLERDLNIFTTFQQKGIMNENIPI